MKISACLAAAVLAAASFTLSTPEAQAFCGVISKEASASPNAPPNRAYLRAKRQVDREVRRLKRQYGAKLVVDQESSACKGGGVGIDENGNEIRGRPSCVVTRGFCVNP